MRKWLKILKKMYNLYTYEKRQKQSEIENIKNLIYSKEYIKKRDKLAKK